MNKQFRYLTILLAAAMAATFAVTAQESNATLNNTTMNNTTLNNTILDNMEVGVANPTTGNSTPANGSADAAQDIGAAASRTAQNLSTLDSQTLAVTPISELAGAAPLVAAGASSAQVASEPAGSFKIGTGVGGLDPFNPEHKEIEALKLGIPIKPMRDTGKMFFVCDLV